MLDRALAGLPVKASAGSEIASVEVRGVCCDSRRVMPGDLFVVWSGGNHDGRRFAADAVARGAAAVLAPGGPLASWAADVPWLEAEDPRWLLGPLASRVYGHPERELRLVAVTGTNGKTTTTYLVRSLLRRAGYPCGVLGTLGYHFGTIAEPPARTTPEASDFYRLLREMRDAGAAAVSLEASSHALAQGRLRGAGFEVAVFTNLTRDHLDYHGDMESYFAAKRRLFTEHLAAGGRAVVNRDDPYGRRLLEEIPAALSYGERDADVCAEAVELDLDGIRGRLSTPRGPLDFETPLIGRYNLWNVLAAVAVGEALGLDPTAISEALAEERPIEGRLEPVDCGQPFPVLVDFAHTPAGLEAALSSLRDVWPGRIVVVFGCGGDKDQGKRPQMGRLAGELSDLAIVTDDNPRTEDPTAIHRQVVEGLEQASGARWEVIGDRRSAIARALEVAAGPASGDAASTEGPVEGRWAVLVAGKGHEDTQVVDTVATPFSDRLEIERILGQDPTRSESTRGSAFDRSRPPARDLARAVAVMAGRVVAGAAEGSWAGVALDSRKIQGGEIFFAFVGEQTDGHRYVGAALERGAAAAVIERPIDQDIEVSEGVGGAVIEVEDSLAALHALTRWVREQTPQHLVGITGSAGKTTTKELLTELLGGSFRVAPSPGNLNNLLGFPIALMGIPEDTEWMVAEMGMSTPGELGGVSRLGRPDVAIFTNVSGVHLEAFERAGRPASVHTIAEAKAELLDGLAADGLVIANAADPEVAWIAGRFSAGGGRVVWFALDPSAAVPGAGKPRLEATGLESGVLSDGRYGSRFELFDRETDRSAQVELALHGRINVENLLAAATCAVELGVSIAEVAARARRLGSQPGRGLVRALETSTLQLEAPALLIDDSYNSNPAALRHALEAQASLPGARHWAVLGEMRELGSDRERLHREAGEHAATVGLDRIVGVGPLARALLVAASEGGVDTEWFETAEEAAPRVRAQLRAGDVLLVKGSRGVRLERVIDALLEPTDTNEGEG